MADDPALSLDFSRIVGRECVHYYDSSSGDIAAQHANRFFYRLGEREGMFACPLPRVAKPFTLSRMSRRGMRLDKGTCLPIPGSSQLFVFYHYRTYLFDTEVCRLSETGEWPFRNPLHGGTAIMPDGQIYFGDYSANSDEGPVYVHGSSDQGQSWKPVYSFEEKTVRHVHGVFPDPYVDQGVWLCTGDLDGQCQVLATTDGFRTVEAYGDGSQKWRAASLMFTPDSVIWGMDSPLEESCVVTLNRRSRQLSIGQPLPGPVWFTKQFEGGGAILQTSVEPKNQPGVKSKDAKLFASWDLDRWYEVSSHSKDILPQRLFRQGVLHFSQGSQTSTSFTVHGDGLARFDGRVAVGNLQISRS